MTEHNGKQTRAAIRGRARRAWVRCRAWAGRRWRSFGFAFRGIWLVRRDGNFQVQTVVAAAVTLLVVAYGVTGTRLGLVVVSITAVLSAEVMNTAVERACDFVAALHGIGKDPRIRDIKDLSAAAVLIVALGATVNGLIVFGPQLV
jgi:diacylglycerol kinase